MRASDQTLGADGITDIQPTISRVCKIGGVVRVERECSRVRGQGVVESTQHRLSIDEDGVNDGDEINAGADPTDPLSKPLAVPALGVPGVALLVGLVMLSGVQYIRRRPSPR